MTASVHVSSRHDSMFDWKFCRIHGQQQTADCLPVAQTLVLRICQSKSCTPTLDASSFFLCSEKITKILFRSGRFEHFGGFSPPGHPPAVIADEYHGNGKLLLVRSEELGMRSEEWWMGHTIHIVPQYPFLYKTYTLRRFQILCAATTTPNSSLLIPNCFSLLTNQKNQSIICP